MKWIKHFYNNYLSRLNKYWLVTIGFLLFTFIAGDSNLYQRYLHEKKIRSLQKEISFYENEIETNRKKLNDLHTNKEGLERFAREEYKMKKPNEDLYLIRKK